jgi:hypothetical protein
VQEIASAKSLDRQLYLAAGDIVDVNIAERGSTSHGGRQVVHRRVLRTSNGVVQRGLRRFGPWR